MLLANCVFSNRYNVSEVVQFQLQESYCLPMQRQLSI